MRPLLLGLAVLCGCGTEVVSIPAPPCEQPILDGPVDSEIALEVARCVADDAEAALLSLDGRGSGEVASPGELATWDVILFGAGVVHAVGLGAGLEPGIAAHPPSELFPGGVCNDLVALNASSVDLLPHALAVLGTNEPEPLRFRIASDCLMGATAGQVVVSQGADRMIYSSEGTFVSECLACAADDARACCSL